MARETKETSREEFSSSEKKKNDSILSSLDEMIGQLELSLYGTSKKNDHAILTNQFNDILKGQMDGLNHTKDSDVTSFMAKLFDNDKRLGWNNPDIESFLNSDDGQIMTFLSDAYQNKLLKYADLYEVSSQLIELREAINIMRDAVVSPDLTDGGVSRRFLFDFETDEVEEDITARLEYMESKFKLQKLIKNHIVPKTLTYGKYYAYVLPYSKIFSDFTKKTSDPLTGQSFISDARQYQEKAIVETLHTESVKVAGVKKSDAFEDNYFRECAEEFINQFTESELTQMGKVHYDMKNLDKKKMVENVKTEIKTYMENISVCNEPVPLPFLTESAESLAEYANLFIKPNKKDLFQEVANVEGGVYNSKENKKRLRKSEKDFENITDCYIKLCDPMHLFPLKILNKPIGYFYVQEEDVRPVNGVMTSTVYYNKYDRTGRQRTIIDNLVNRIVMSFDKKFLQENSELKELIAEALMYYDLNSKKLKFQFIPAEYVCEFKVNEDENGEGTSMIEPSLFYAKLYLLLLLFKIVSIILYSNDQKVNYIRTSGIDKNISNKVQEIARDKLNHQVNIMDLMSYTTLLRKIGNGTEMYIPMGRGGERGFETEILQGQEVQLNTELMELLRNCYILGTGVPSAIMNYMNEADFAKSIETANTRFQGRVMSYQIDFNDSLSEFYRLIGKHSGMIKEDNIDSVDFQLTPPKFANNLIKQESLTSFEGIKTFITNLFLGEQWQSDPAMIELAQALTKKLVEKYLPMIDIAEVEEWMDEIKLQSVETKLDPSKKSTENIDDFADEL